ncbi:TlpA disulfide reductase family protein [Marinobacterium aestuariivivens]|uniref:TlpA disulfide reductase family protein n=1 Tax=Marinobacterium aestuariivivens TaxID=1698799 RepID=A0ABW2A6R2_9GAMM
MRTLATLLLLGLSLLQPVRAGMAVYDLSFTDLEHRPIALDQFRGQVLLLNFWATWCPPCIREMPAMDRLQRHFPDDGLAVVAVNVGESAEAIETFRARLERPLGFRILLDESGSAFTELGIPGLPMTYLYGRDGTLIDTVAGGHEWDSPERIEQIGALLK